MVRIGREDSVDICDDTVRMVLNFYPEEELIHRPFFKKSFRLGTVSYKNLLRECELVHIPWQMFFLTKNNLNYQLNHIKKIRKYKFSKKFFTKRKGVGEKTSTRIIDRLIRLQNFIVETSDFPKNEFCGSLKGKNKYQSIKFIIDFFRIDHNKIYSKTKDNTLNYLIEKIEAKNINVSRGVFKGGILPEVNNINGVYKNTSGFVIKDEYIPFLFLPDKVNPEEVSGRRIYTLMYLLTCIGLDDYDFYIESDFKASALKKDCIDSLKHDIVAGVLLPEEETEKLKGEIITSDDVFNLSESYKITPTATVVILRRRNIITKEQYESLLPDPYIPSNNLREEITLKKPAKIINSVKKFCGTIASESINKAIKENKLNNIEIQYLIFGRVRKKEYKEYCSQIKI